MEEEKAIVFRISDLIQRARPLTVTASLSRSRHVIPTSEAHQDSDHNHRRRPSPVSCQNPNPETLKPLNYPAILVGNLTLPSFPSDGNSTIKCSCFQFSDGSATVCCEILDFNPKMIGRKIRILTWNFIPFKCGDDGVKNGYLEIISWGFLQPCSENLCSLSSFSSFCLSSGACDVKDNFRASSLIFGAIESISPVSLVPCATMKSSSRNIRGFLVNILVCECKFCVSKFSILELNNLTEENVKEHCFTKAVIVYFCGLTSSWHPVISRLIGNVVLLLGLKKKMVFIGKKESQLMFVPTDKVALHISKVFEKQKLNCKGGMRGKSEFGSYTGVVTGAYLQGMVVELDQDVMLLTDRYLCVPHCVRVGALVTLKNVHLVDPKFSWGRMLILGACCKSSVCVEFFSPLETVCHLKSHSQSLLQKFIDSLSLPARLWALLVMACFRKKFAGKFSEKEILGSKHTEGLAQKYASSHLPLSAFLLRHGVLVEFCKHDICSVGKEGQYGNLRLVLPIANLIGFCESSWKKILDDLENSAHFLGGINQKKPLFCGGKIYPQPIRKVLRAGEIGVILLGTLKISLSSGRLQLSDATGGVDVTLDLPATGDFDRIFEAKDFLLVMEGIPQKLVNLNSIIGRPLSCQSIFCNAPLVTRTKMSFYLCCHQSDEDSFVFDRKINSQELESGKFHLLKLTHKFPFRLKSQKDQSNRFAQAIILPWNLLVVGKHEDAVSSRNSQESLTSSLKHFTISEKYFTHKRCKTSHSSTDGSFNGVCISDNKFFRENTSCVSNQLSQLPCLIGIKGMNYRCVGMLCTNEHAKIISSCKTPRSKVLLEFSPESFCIYEVLKVGRCYLVKHQKEDKFCSIKENYQVHHLKICISPETNLWSLTFSSIEAVQSSDAFQFPNSQFRSTNTISNGFEIPSPTGSTSSSDINVFVPANALKSIENVIKIAVGDPLKEESDSHDHGLPVINATIPSECPLPVGNLVSLHGLVVALHDFDRDSLSAQSRLVSGEGCLPISLQENGGVCVHVSVEGHTVRICCNPSRQALPVGLGEGVCASFHRVLVRSGQNKYMMTPVSFITIDNVALICEQPINEFNCPSGRTVGPHSIASPDTVPTALISDFLQFSELKPIRFRCRVIAVYVLVMEKIGKTKILQSSVQDILSSIGIPLAGFVLDDGSSSCCCWAVSERAATLLGLNSEEDLLEASGKMRGRCKTVGFVNQILEQHEKIVVRNYGSIHDSSCQDLTISLCSDKLISSSDEDLLRSLITNTPFSTSWTVVGSPMDPKATSWLEERLTELDMAMPPLRNLWVTDVCHADILTEARNIMQELV